MRCFVLLLAVALSACAGVSTRTLEREEWSRRPRSDSLLAGLRSEDPALRERAAVAMGRIQSAEYESALVDAVSDADERVRAAAVFALGQLRIDSSVTASSRAVEALFALRRAQGEPGELAALAVEALGKAGGADMEPTLAALLASPDAAVRREAVVAVFRLRYLKRIPAYSTGTVRALTAALSHDDPETRWRAAYAFSRWPEPSAAADLASSLAREEWRSRLFALRALAQVGAPAAGSASAVAPLQSDPDEHVRVEALLALKALGRVPLMEEQSVWDPSPHVRAAGAQAAADGRLADDASALVRGQAVQSLAGRLGESHSAGVEAALRDAGWWVRSRAALAAAGLPASGPRLLDAALRDRDVRVRAAAVEGWAERSEPEADRVVSGALAAEASPREVRGTAIEAAGKRARPELFDGLVRAYELSEGRELVELRESVVDAAEALARSTGAPAGLEPFRRSLLEDPAPSVRSKAAQSLGLAADPVAPPPPPPLEPVSGRPVVELETERGALRIELDSEAAPLHAASFVSLVRRGVYDGTPFHRVVSNFVIQGGDPRGSGWGDAGYSIPDEINRIRFERGVVGMPKAGKDTGGCQLFITHVPTPHLDGRYTAFGRVVEGLEIVDRIEPGDLILRARLR